MTGSTTVHLKLAIVDILSVNDNDFSISLYAYLGSRWKDPRLFLDRALLEQEDQQRLSVEPQLAEYTRLRLESVLFLYVYVKPVSNYYFSGFLSNRNPTSDDIRHLWVPNLMILNLKTFRPLSEAPHPQTTLTVLNKTQGHIELLYVQGVLITFLCPMRYVFCFSSLLDLIWLSWAIIFFLRW